jgi:tetratricopeptide (TPR) repeat protein
MMFWTAFKAKTRPAAQWLRKRWAPAAAAAAILATTLGVITDLDSLLDGAPPTSGVEASALAARVAAHLESSAIARGGEYGGNTDLEQALDRLTVSDDNRVQAALRELDSGNSAAAFELLETSALRVTERDPAQSAQRYFDLGVLAEAENPRQAMQFYQAALDINPDNARTLDRLGVLYLEQGDADRAEALHLQALEQARAGADETEQSIILGSLGSVQWMRGDFETADAYYTQALELADFNGDLFRSARHLGNRGLIAEARGDTTAAETYYTRALALMEEVGDAVGTALAQNNLGNVYRQRGEFDRAEDLYRRAQATFESEGHPQRAAFTLSNLGTVAEVRGDFEAAARFYQRSLDRARDYQYVRAIERAARSAGWMALRRGDLGTARSLADEALAAALLTPDPASEADALILSVGVAASSGNDPLARDHAARAFTIIESRDVPPQTRAYIHDALALAAFRANDLEEARRQAEQALTLYTDAQLVASMAEQQLRLATLAFGRNEASIGCDYLGEAEINYGRAGFVAEANRLVDRRDEENCPARPRATDSAPD